jgi:hypothetical protein
MKEQGIKISLCIILGLISCSFSFGQAEKVVKSKTITEIEYSHNNDTIVKTKEFDLKGLQINPIDTSIKIGYLTKSVTLDSSKIRVLKKHYFDNGSHNFTETIIEEQTEKLLCYSSQQDTLYCFIKYFDKKGCLKSMVNYFDKQDSLKYEIVGINNYSEFETLHKTLSQTDLFIDVLNGEIRINFKKGTIKYFRLSNNGKYILTDKFHFDKQFNIKERTNYFYHESFKKTFKTKTYYSFNQNHDLIELKVINDYGEVERLKIITYKYY